MANSFDTFRTRVSKMLESRGAKAELCRKTGIPRSALDRWLNGENEPSMSNLDRIAEALGFEPWQLIQGTEPVRPALPEGVRQAIREELNSRPEPAHPVMARPIEKLMAAKGLQAEHMAPAVLNLFALELHELDALVEQINQMVLEKLEPKKRDTKKSG
jgi:transcriptional regulator with XRE-family HTH domain